MPAREIHLTELLTRIAAGDGEAMQELFLLERSSMHRLFLGLTHRAGVADDLVQGTFLNVWRYRSGFRGRGSAAGYLYRIAINQWRAIRSKDVRRRDAWRELLTGWTESSGDDASTALERSEGVTRIHAAIDALPAEQREVFLLHREQGMSCPEIARVTETNLKTVESRLRLALKKLTARLEAARAERSDARAERLDAEPGHTSARVVGGDAG